MTKVPGHNRSCASRNNHFVSEKTNNLGINILNALCTESIQHRSLCLLAALVCIGEAFLRFYCAPQVHTHTHSTLERLKRQDTEPERERGWIVVVVLLLFACEPQTIEATNIQTEWQRESWNNRPNLPKPLDSIELRTKKKHNSHPMPMWYWDIRTASIHIHQMTTLKPYKIWP